MDQQFIRGQGQEHGVILNGRGVIHGINMVGTPSVVLPVFHAPSFFQCVRYLVRHFQKFVPGVVVP